MEINLRKYSDFVDKITSISSKDFNAYLVSLNRLQTSGCDIARLDTAITGLMSESGEAGEILKKLKFHNKEWTAEIKQHLSRELGDLIWYWTNACRALNLDPNQVIADNVTKLESRYPGGVFSTAASETRAAGDI